jgi:hypothetical protein
MSEIENTSGPRLKRLLCKRTGEQVEVATHAECPYCFGRAAEIEEGRHEAFCDYQPEKDPMHFGFPADTSRDVQG